MDAEDERMVTRWPRDLVRRINRILDEHQKHKGPGRTIEIHLNLDPETGQVVPFGTYVLPPKEWTQTESA